MKLETMSKETEEFWNEHINQNVWAFVNNNATTSVRSRLESCYRHYTKALIIKNIDPEMSAIRLVASEEELAVAVFDIIKRNEDSFIDCKHITKKFKNHFVKQLFSPAVHIIAIIVSTFLENGVSIDVIEASPGLDASIEPIITEDKVMLRLHIGEKHIDNSPFNFVLNRSDEKEDVAEALYEEFEKRIKNSGYNSVKEFSKHKVDFRNKIFYAEDAMIFDVGEEIESVLFLVTQTLNEVLWVVALLLSDDDSPTKKWGIASQFLRLYDRILKEAKVI